MDNFAPRAVRVSLLTALLATSMILVIRTSAQNNASPQSVAAGEKTIDQTQKNIQILKGLPESQLVPVMNYMGASLGVRCNYCHVNKDGNNWDFASDEKGEKVTARKMITMVKDINKGSFNGNTEITCYTCHRGRTGPMGTPQLPLAEPSPRPDRPGRNNGGQAGPEPQRPTLPTVDEILDKYVAALGGAANIEKVKSRVLKGTVVGVNGNSFAYELYQSAPEKVLAVMTGPQGVTERAFNGTAGWEKGVRGLRDLSTEEVYFLRRYPDMIKDIKIKDQFTRLSVAGKPKIDNRDVYVLRGMTSTGRREQLYFDAETGLLIRRVSSIATPVGNIPEQVDFEDYRDVDGVKMPFTVKVSSVDQFYSVTRKFTDIKINVAIDEKRFNKPS
jgi:photosynthetic reaction center cytochrome c subunit